MKRNLISIVIPLYNKENSILPTINSVLTQTYIEFELIIINDGSTDNSEGIVNEIKDDRIKLFSIVNGGVSMARNYGAKKASAEFIFFLDADDTLLPDCLSNYVEVIEEYPNINFFTSNFFIRDKEGDQKLFCYGKNKGLLSKPFKSFWKREIFPKAGSMLIRKQNFEEVGGFRSECSIWEDLDLVLSLLQRNEIVYFPSASCIYNLEFSELSQKLKPLQCEFAYYIDLNNNKNIYHKLILLELLSRTLNKRKELNDINAIKYLKKEIGLNKPILFLGKVERYILKKIRSM